MSEIAVIETEKPTDKEFKAVTYECSTPNCRHRMTVRYFPNEILMQVACCVKCKAGFGLPVEKMLADHQGMFIKKVEWI